MTVELTLTVLAEVPDDLRTGDVLHVNGEVTVHTIQAELADGSTYSPDGRTTWIPTVKSVGVYSNLLKFTKADA